MTLAAGVPASDVLTALKALRAGDAPTHGGRTTAYVYDSGRPELDALAGEAMAAYAWVNGLDPTAFTSVAVLERDLVAAAAALLGGNGRVAGSVTSGGTESCLLAVKAARDLFAARHPDRRPQLVLPVTAHPAFAKAAHYLGVEPVVVPVDPASGSVAAAGVAAALGDRTALVVVSAPAYPYGVLDPVAEVAALAAEAGVPCHVDACIGGWVLPYLARLGVAVPPFDLTVPGVTSLSVDLHKYAYAPKGTSVLLYAGNDDGAALRRHQFFAFARWPGYPVVNSVTASTRTVAPMAAAWAVLRHLGDDGYLALARQTLDATAALRAGIDAVPGLRVVGRPASSLVACAAEEGSGVDVFHVADEMAALGWYVHPQPGYPQPGRAYGPFPRTLHFTVTAATGPVVQPLLTDLATAVDRARGMPPAEVAPQWREQAALLDPAALGEAEVDAVLALAGLGGDGAPALPERAAPVHALLEGLPPALVERLLVGFLTRVLGPGPGS